MKWFDFPNGERPTDAEITQAYATLFNVETNESQIVLADLAEKTGFFKVSGVEATPNELMHEAGMRAAFAIIFGHITLTDNDRLMLANVSRKMAETQT